MTVPYHYRTTYHTIRYHTIPYLTTILGFIYRGLPSITLPYFTLPPKKFKAMWEQYKGGRTLKGRHERLKGRGYLHTMVSPRLPAAVSQEALMARVQRYSHLYSTLPYSTCQFIIVYFMNECNSYACICMIVLGELSWRCRCSRRAH